MKKLSSLSLFFPAYNEEGNIEETIRRAREVGEQVSNLFEIIIIDDGSRDKTGEIVDAFAREDSRIHAIHHFPNQGYGGAVRSGLTASRYEYIFFTDSDLQFDLKEITKLIEHIPKYDVVIGYRTKRADSLSFLRLMNAKGWNLLNRIFFGLKVRDIDCAFKLFKAEVLRGMELQSRGAMLSAELLIRLMWRGLPFKEVPVSHFPNKTGHTTGAKPMVILRAFKELVQFFFWSLTENRRR